MKFKDFLLSEAVERELFYHGTTDKLLPTVLSQGLVPNPKKRTWSKDEPTWHNPSRMSLEGVYVTTNLLTATSSARNAIKALGGKDLLVVMMSLQPKSLVADEDDITFFAKDIVYPGVSPNEWFVSELYKTYLHLNTPNFYTKEYGEEYGQREQERDEQHLKTAQDAYVDNVLSGIQHKLKNYQQKLNPQYIARLTELLKKGFFITLARKAAHNTDWKYKSISPDIVKSEKDYSDYMDALTRSLKQLTRTNLDKFNLTARALEPIGFSGKNKIVCIIKIGYDSGMIKVVYGQLPPQFIQDFEKTQGNLDKHLEK